MQPLRLVPTFVYWKTYIKLVLCGSFFNVPRNYSFLNSGLIFNKSYQVTVETEFDSQQMQQLISSARTILQQSV